MFDRKAYMAAYKNRPGMREHMREVEQAYRDRLVASGRGLEMWRVAKRKYNASAKGKKRTRERRIKNLDGLTPHEYAAMLEAQGFCCAICDAEAWENKQGVLHVDHDHQTGEVRGLLCSRCNTALGLMEDRPERLSRAIRYLRG